MIDIMLAIATPKIPKPKPIIIGTKIALKITSTIIKISGILLFPKALIDSFKNKNKKLNI